MFTFTVKLRYHKIIGTKPRTVRELTKNSPVSHF